MWWLLTAWAAPEAGWSVRPWIGTEVPVMVGGGVVVEAPFRVRLEASVGYLPRPYVQLSNDVVGAFFPEEYPSSTQVLVEESLSSSVVGRGRLGWRPFPRHGWHFGAGASVLALGGNATGVELIEGLTGQEVPEPRTDGSVSVDARATLVLVDVVTGWDVPIWRGLVVTPSLGWSFTVASQARLEPSWEPQLPAAARALDTVIGESEVFLQDTFEGYVHPPWIGLAVGWRLPVQPR